MNSSIKYQILKNNFFKSWISGLKKNKVKILKTKYLFKILRKNSNWQVLGVDTKIKVKNNTYYRYAQISPESVTIVPILKIKKQFYTMLVSQFRAPAGGYTFEFPAGSINNRMPKKTAQQEIFEELNLNVEIKDIKPLIKKKLYVDSAFSTSSVHYFYFKKKIDTKFLEKFKNKKTGISKEGEFLKLKIVKFNNVLKYATTTSTVAALALCKKNEKIFK